MSVDAALGRSDRDTKLALAAGVLILAGLLVLLGESIHLSVLMDSVDIPIENTIAQWLEVAKSLPSLAAIALAMTAFLVAGEARHYWLRRAFLLAAWGYGIAVAAGLLDFFAITDSRPHDFKVAAGAGVVAWLGLWVAALLAASAFSADATVERREATLRRAAAAIVASFVFTAISAFEYAVAYSNYSHHDKYVGGLVVQGLGSCATVVAAGIGARAFRQRAASGSDESRWVARERRLFHAAVALTLGFLVIALGEAQTAAGATAIGYSQSGALADGVFAASHVVYAAAIACAAIGFSRASARRD